MSKYLSSKYIIIVIAIFTMVCHVYLRAFNYNDWHNVFGWDVLAYYIYLPFNFIYGDPGISDKDLVDQLFETYNFSGTYYQAFKLENGNWSPMYTTGMAFLYLPFFLIGHGIALITDYPADGFSYPYALAVDNGVVIYVLIGYFVSRKILLRFFSDGITSLTLIFMMLGTSLFHETLINAMAPHAPMFAGLTLCLYLFLKWLDRPSFKTSFFLGTVVGLCVLVRGSDLIIGLIFLFWGIYNKDTLMSRISFLKTNYKSLLVAVAGLMVFPILQMIYWKIVTGDFIFNTYQVTPGFDWLEPHFINVFFSYKKGWFVYTPIISFVFIGIYLMWKRNKEMALSVTLFFSLNVYMICSWATWWQGGSFGCRYFVESYAILILPLGVFVNEIVNKKMLRYTIIPIGFFFVFLNLFQTWQFNNWILDGYAMTKEYYWKSFLKTSIKEEDKKLKSVARDFKETETFDNINDYTGHTLAYADFDEINTFHIKTLFFDTTHSRSGKYSCKIHPEYTYGPNLHIPWNEMTDKDHVWLRIKFWFYTEHDLKESGGTFVAQLDHSEGQYIEKGRGFPLDNYDYELNQWNYVEIDYLTPYPLSTNLDKMTFFPYVSGSLPIWIDDWEIEVYERNW